MVIKGAGQKLEKEKTKCIELAEYYNESIITTGGEFYLTGQNFMWQYGPTG